MAQNSYPPYINLVDNWFASLISPFIFFYLIESIEQSEALPLCVTNGQFPCELRKLINITCWVRLSK